MKNLLCGFFVMLFFPIFGYAEQQTAEANFCENDLWSRLYSKQSFSDGWFGLNNYLGQSGVEVATGVTQVYQQNVRGGLSTHHRSGRYSGSYDVELNFDMHKLFGIENARMYMLTEGSWSDGINDSTVGSFFGVNGDAAGYRTIDVTELWYEQDCLVDGLRVRLGKLDLTGGFECRGCPVSFDGSVFANDETTQFLNNAFINNPTIPFPDNGLGAVLYYNPQNIWYISAAAADAQADARETGFNTAFHGKDYFFYIFETGITPQFKSDKGPLQGAYRLGMWYDPQPRSFTGSSKVYRDGTGAYLSFCQLLIKENDTAEDTQGLGAFFRYGITDEKKNDIVNFSSFGIQYQGLFDGRDADVLGLGFAQGVFSDKANSTYTNDHEDVVEMYYNAQILPWLNFSPSVQYIKNPGGIDGIKDAVVVGVRLQMAI